MCIVCKVKFESPYYCTVQLLWGLFFVILLLCDTCAFMALVVGVMRHCLPIPLAISYGFTGMAALWMYLYFVFVGCIHQIFLGCIIFATYGCFISVFIGIAVFLVLHHVGE